MNQPEIRPPAVHQKSLAVLQSVAAGNSSVSAISTATGFPASTILRVLSLLVEDDDIVDASMVDGQLNLTFKPADTPEASR